MITIFILMYLHLCLYVFITSSIQSIILTASTFLFPLFVKISVLFFLMIYPGINITKLLFLRPINHLAYYVKLSVKLTVFRQKSGYTYLLLDQHCCIVHLLWRPYQLHHIQVLDKVQRRATKYILSDYTSNYKSRLSSLISCHLAMYLFELADIMFFIKLSNTHLISLIFWTTLNSILALQDLLNRN